MEDREAKFIMWVKVLLPVIIIVLGISGYFYYTDRQKNAAIVPLVQKCKSLIEQGAYEDASKSIKEAASIKEAEEVKNLITVVNNLIESDKNFQSAVKLVQEENYKLAIDTFKKVNDSDTKNYAAAQNHIKQASDSFALQTLSEAKKLYAAGDYKKAYQTLKQAQGLSPTIEEAKQLETTYEKSKHRQEEQERLEAERIAREAAREKMKKYEISTGSVGIAVGEVKTSSRVYGDYGHYRYVKDSQSDQFLWLWIGAANHGTKTVHVNPNDFTVTSPDGYTANYDQTSFDTKYLEATNVPPNSYTSGWLIFIVPKADKYTLHYRGFGGSATKEIIP